MIARSLPMFSLLELWFVLSVLFLLLLALLLLWYAYPTLKRIMLCSWCWRDLRLEPFFPEAWSSSICAHHERVQEDLARARRVRLLQERSAS